MGILTVTTFVTLDGVMQAPGGPEEDPSGGFKHGGWSFPYSSADADFGAFMMGVFDKPEAFLLGRTTYQLFAGHWSRVTDPADPIAGKLNALPKYVASRTLTKADWNNTTIVRDVAGEVAKLKQRHAGEVQVHGSAGLLQSLLQHDLIDAFNVLTFPVLLGSGRRLFGEGTVPTALKLASSRTGKSGIVMSRYERAGKPAYGSFALDP
jgi:dihydrofolate reductase